MVEQLRAVLRAAIVRHLLLIGFIVMTPLAARADHMNGSYAGTGQFARYALFLAHDGRSIYGEILEADTPVLTLQGFTDGGDVATGEVFGVETNEYGTFQLVHQPAGVRFDMILDNIAYQILFRSIAGGAPDRPPEGRGFGPADGGAGAADEVDGPNEAEEAPEEAEQRPEPDNEPAAEQDTPPANDPPAGLLPEF